MREQLVLDLPHRAALGAEDFLVSDCNIAAVRLIDEWPDWRHPVQLLIGPPASGKTHLSRVWQARSGAVLTAPESPALALAAEAQPGSGFVIENADRGEIDEKALFHLMNLAVERRLYLLLTAEKPASRWGVVLPDLLSRLNALPCVEIGTPDEALLKTVMLKHFADRQLNIEPRVLDYLALHVERSLQAASEAVAAVDRVALASGRKISRQLVAEALRGHLSAE
jgi:chromosomal replication initiation ATPase DnaA